MKRIHSRKLLACILLCALAISAMTLGVSAACEKNDKAVVFSFDTIVEGSADPYKTTAADDAIVSLYTWGAGSMTYADGNLVIVPKDNGKNMLEGVIIDANWHFSTNEYRYMKIRYKTSAASSFAPAATYWMPGNGTSMTFDLNLSGNWEELIIDLTKADGLGWLAYKDNNESSASYNTDKIRSFRIDFPKDSAITYSVDYLAFFKTEADAKTFDGTMASLEPAAPAAAPSTADASAIAILALTCSAAAALILRKKH
ncbi:MAG: hypothetical protein IJ493_00280 [Clostridia bacterium]|nr:hypothetical protein [Clostridia bacterium]